MFFGCPSQPHGVWTRGSLCFLIQGVLLPRAVPSLAEARLCTESNQIGGSKQLAFCLRWLFLEEGAGLSLSLCSLPCCWATGPCSSLPCQGWRVLGQPLASLCFPALLWHLGSAFSPVQLQGAHGSLAASLGGSGPDKQLAGWRDYRGYPAMPGHTRAQPPLTVHGEAEHSAPLCSLRGKIPPPTCHCQRQCHTVSLYHHPETQTHIMLHLQLLQSHSRHCPHDPVPPKQSPTCGHLPTSHLVRGSLPGMGMQGTAYSASAPTPPRHTHTHTCLHTCHFREPAPWVMSGVRV